MCGIMGWFVIEEISDEQKAQVFKLGEEIFKETQSRGSDASGFSYVNKFRELVTVKGAIGSKDMVNEPKYKKLAEVKNFPRIFMGHCRQMTQGDPADNHNNHPLVVDKTISVIHNGCISNDKPLRTEFNLKGKGEVDSEVIPLLIMEKLKEYKENDKTPLTTRILESINLTSQLISGGYACAAIEKDTPNSLYLFNSKNPIVLAYSEKLKTIFFASTQYIVDAGIRESKLTTESEITHFGIFKQKVQNNDLGISYIPLADNTLVLLDLDIFKSTTKSPIKFYDLETKPWSNVAVKTQLIRDIKEKHTYVKELDSSYGRYPNNGGRRSHQEDWERAGCGIGEP